MYEYSLEEASSESLVRLRTSPAYIQHLCYGGTGYVLVQNGPLNSGITATLYGWDWAKHDRSRKGFKIYDAFDFAIAANTLIVADGYHGNIGLAPRHRSVISFGHQFPFQAPDNPDTHFSPRIPTVSHTNKRPLSWTVKLFRIGIRKYGTEFAWIDMSNEPSATGPTGSRKGIDILMDTGNPLSVLPDHVLSKIQSDDKWQSPKSSISTGQRANALSEMLVGFEFQGEGSNVVMVEVRALEFLSWPPRVGAGDRVNIEYNNIKGTAEKNYTLGQVGFSLPVIHVYRKRELVAS
ncbi:hypothetical protein C8R42DRAFT_727772 [Lentinula raphanica]|nr:hypothetical protein C8R42DRAFT_727772 [Lentinula raphanica]